MTIGQVEAPEVLETPRDWTETGQRARGSLRRNSQIVSNPSGSGVSSNIQERIFPSREQEPPSKLVVPKARVGMVFESRSKFGDARWPRGDLTVKVTGKSGWVLVS